MSHTLHALHSVRCSVVHEHKVKRRKTVLVPNKCMVESEFSRGRAENRNSRIAAFSESHDSGISIFGSSSGKVAHKLVLYEDVYAALLFAHGPLSTALNVTRATSAT